MNQITSEKQDELSKLAMETLTPFGTTSFWSNVMKDVGDGAKSGVKKAGEISKSLLTKLKPSKNKEPKINYDFWTGPLPEKEKEKKQK